LDIPMGTVMSRLWRGRKLLQKSLWEYSTQRNDSERKNQEGWTVKKP
ncbi:MAG TPA: RNA polymerase subunit sigma-24, partial [Candidatus Atribacteria bacterium]|nr:RNA polymerase subunit sigma-24 [Candidatus Atribacteria bacterium]